MIELNKEYLKHYASLNDTVEIIDEEPYSIEGVTLKLQYHKLMIEILEKYSKLS
jgi:hypothetical protein